MSPYLLFVLLVVLLVAAIYTTTVTHGFVWDDTAIIVDNPLLETLRTVPLLLLSEDMVKGFTGYYRPMTYLTFALDRAIWGVKPLGFHFTNLVLEILVVLLFYAVTIELLHRRHLAFVASVIFALHPVAGETINFLAGGRNTLLAACFALLSLLFYLKQRSGLAVACFAAAILSKEFALLLPLVFLFNDYRLKKRSRFADYSPYLICAICYLALRGAVVHQANFLATINPDDALSAPYLVVRYLLNILFPFDLKVLYDVRPHPLTSLLCLTFVTGMMAVAYRLRKYDEILFAAFWGVLFLLPAVNIIPLQSASLIADRHAYFSLMGFALLAAMVIGKLNTRVAAVGTVLVCGVYAWVDLSRNGAWKDEVAFFTQMTIDAPEKFDGDQNLGMYYHTRGEMEKAVRHLSVALDKRIDSAELLIGSASVFWKENLLDKAERALVDAVKLGPANLEPYLMLITIYERSGNLLLAASYRQMVETWFHDVEGRLSQRAVELCRAGEEYVVQRLFVPAENVFWQALQINRDHIPALLGLASVYAARGKVEEAGQYCSRILALEPENAAAQKCPAKMHRPQARPAEADREAARVGGRISESQE